MRHHPSPTLLAAAFLVAGCATGRRHAMPEVLAASAPPPAAAAQMSLGPQEGDWAFTMGGSGASDNDFDNGSFGTAASAGYFLSDRSELGVRQGLNYSDFGGSEWNGSTRVYFDYHLARGALRPIVGANLGWVYGDSVDETLEAAPEVGLQWYATDTAFLFGLIEYQFFFEDADDADDTFDDGSFVYTVGVGFRK